jgi:hypothetical protein
MPLLWSVCVIPSQSKYNALAQLKESIESDQKKTMAELTQHYDEHIQALKRDQATELKQLERGHAAEIDRLRSLHTQECGQMRESHTNILADMRENYQSELERTKSELTAQIKDARTHDAVESIKGREELVIKLAERTEEVRSLHASIDAERKRTDGLLKEIETARSDLKQQSAVRDSLQAEVSQSL